MPREKRKIVIIGAGAAGVFTAHALEREAPGRFDITLLERGTRVGGHAKSMLVQDGGTVNVGGGTVNVDCGAQFFSDGAQPDYVEMLREEGFFSDPSPIFKKDVGITLWDSENDELLFKVPTTLLEILMQLPTRGLDWLNFLVLTIESIELYAKQDWSLEFGPWMESLNFMGSPAEVERFKRDVARPFMYSFGLVPPGQLDSLSAKFVVYYFVGSLPWDGGGLFSCYNSEIGLDGIQRKLLEKVGIAPTLNTEVFDIRKEEDQYIISTAPQGAEYVADEIVFACGPPRTLSMLPEVPPLQPLREVLSDLQRDYLYVPVRMQQDEPDYMPANRRDWSASNILRMGPAEAPHTFMLSVWFGALRNQPAGRHYFKSWGSPFLDPIQAHSFVEEMHELMIGTPDFIAKRDEIAQKFQGRRNLWFAGGWVVDYDSQNAALKSARIVAQGLIDNDREIRREGRGRSELARRRPSGSRAPQEREHPGVPAFVEDLVERVASVMPDELVAPLVDACRQARSKRGRRM